MPKQDDETLAIQRCRRHLEGLKTPGARRRVVAYLSSAVEDMQGTSNGVSKDPRQLEIAAADRTARPIEAPFE